MANEATWKQRVASWRASGLTAREFCEGRDFAVGTLRWWACRLERGPRRVGSAMPLARVVPATRPPTAVRSGSGVSIEVAGARIAVEAGFDQATLASVLEVMTQGEARR